jgi:hypothetical protein
MGALEAEKGDLEWILKIMSPKGERRESLMGEKLGNEARSKSINSKKGSL